MLTGPALTALAGLAAALPQGSPDPRAPLERELAAGEPGRVEEARRRLWLRNAADLELEPLLEALQLGEGPAGAAASVLGHHGLARAERRSLLQRDETALQLAVLDLADDAELTARLRHPDPALRVAALRALADRGRLEADALAAALDDQDPAAARAALRLLLFELAPFPAGVLAELSGPARERLLQGLSERPREAAAAWLLRLLERDALSGEERMLAIAALPREALDVARGREVLAAAGEVDTAGMATAVRKAAVRLPPPVADQLVGAAHARVVDGARIEDVLACLENATSLGERQVLALSTVLPPETIEHVCMWLAARDSTGLRDYVAAALDGETPLELHLLRRAAPQIDTPQRLQRVLRVLRDGAPDLRVLAFYALIDAGVYHPDLLAFALETAEGAPGAWANRTQRLRALMRVPLDRFPAEVVLRLLDDQEPEVRHAICRALIGTPYPPEVETELLRRATDPTAKGAAAAGRAIASFGSREAVAELWARGGHEVRLAAVDWLRERPKPWTLSALRAAVAGLGDPAGDARRLELRDEILRGLAALGDRAAADELLRRVAELPESLLRRCGTFAPQALEAQHVATLRPLLVGSHGGLSDAAREEVVRWLSARPDLGVESILAEVYRSDPSDEVRRAALAGLLRGSGAPELHARLRAAVERGLGSAERELAYEILAAVPHPARALDLETIARLLLLAPLADPSAECGASLGEFPRSGDYPLHLPIIDVLRRQPSIDPAPFEAVAAEAARHPARHALSGRRLGHFLCEAARFQHLRATLGPLLAELILLAPDDPARFAGAAHLILGEAAEARSSWAEAAEHYARAARSLLRDPLPPLAQRVLLGDDDLAAGVLPEAALAARPHLCRARDALERGDHGAARGALALARDLGAEDRAIERDVEECTRRLER